MCAETVHCKMVLKYNTKLVSPIEKIYQVLILRAFHMKIWSYNFGLLKSNWMYSDFTMWTFKHFKTTINLLNTHRLTHIYLYFSLIFLKWSEKQPFYIRHCRNNGQTVTKTNEDIAFWGKKWRTWLSLSVWKQHVSIKRVYLLLHCDHHISKLRSMWMWLSVSLCVMRRQKSEQISKRNEMEWRKITNK